MHVCIIYRHNRGSYIKSYLHATFLQRVRIEGSYDLSCNIAKSPQNKNLNRYRDVLPYDHSRIVLNGSNTDYINASLVEVIVYFFHFRKWIYILYWLC